MVAMEEFRLQVVSPFYHRSGRLRAVPGIFFSDDGDIRAGRCYHRYRGDAVNRELGHDSPWMRRPLEDVVPGAFSFWRRRW